MLQSIIIGRYNKHIDHHTQYLTIDTATMICEQYIILLSAAIDYQTS